MSNHSISNFSDNKENFDYIAQKWTSPLKNNKRSFVRTPLKDITEEAISIKKNKTNPSLFQLMA